MVIYVHTIQDARHYTNNNDAEAADTTAINDVDFDIE